jgi:hypothetical protein
MAEPVSLLMSSIDMDPEKFKGDFESYRKRMQKLCPVIRDALKHLDDIVVEYFGGQKSLVVEEKDKEFICSALDMRRKPVAVVLGQMNCGKSTLLNEIFQRDNLVPTSQQRCTARLVYLDYVDDYDKETWQLVDIDGKNIGEPQPLIESERKKKKKRGKKGKEASDEIKHRKRLPINKIDLPGTGSQEAVNSRDDEKAVQQIVHARVHVDILKYGIQLVDSPGFGESVALDNLFVALIEKDLEPLIIYVIDGNQTWRETVSCTCLFYSIVESGILERGVFWNFLKLPMAVCVPDLYSLLKNLWLYVLRKFVGIRLHGHLYMIKPRLILCRGFSWPKNVLQYQKGKGSLLEISTCALAGRDKHDSSAMRCIRKLN